ncbi:MAG: GtrA family protein [Sphingobacteriales bacterium]|nr:GtrA family protein [Sphingobacteriales bacterium]
MPKDKIIAFLDFFYPPFRKIMPVQTFRYAACGASNVVFGNLMYTFIYKYVFSEEIIHIGPYALASYSIALVISSFITFGIGFLLNKYVVFTTSNLNGKVQLFRYFVAFLLNLFLNYILLKVFVEYFKLAPVLSQRIIIVIVTGVSYLVQNHFTFKTKRIYSLICFYLSGH